MFDCALIISSDAATIQNVRAGLETYIKSNAQIAAVTNPKTSASTAKQMDENTQETKTAKRMSVGIWCISLMLVVFEIVCVFRPTRTWRFSVWNARDLDRRVNDLKSKIGRSSCVCESGVCVSRISGVLVNPKKRGSGITAQRINGWRDTLEDECVARQFTTQE